MSHPAMIVSPATRSADSRRLVIRNPTKQTFAVKVSKLTSLCIQLNLSTAYHDTTSSDRLEVTPTCAVIEPGRSRNFKVTLSEPKVILGTGSFYLVVMCRPVGTLPSEAYNVWFETPYGRDTEIARKISVIKSLGYCAQETVMDLPDQASAVFSYWYPTTTIDDSDTLTARNVESETLTAQMIDELDVCDDATNGAVMEGAGDGFQNSQITPKNSNVQRYAWIWKFVDVVFPPIGDSSEQISPPCGSS